MLTPYLMAHSESSKRTRPAWALRLMLRSEPSVSLEHIVT